MLLAIVPAYNEEKKIGEVVEQLIRHTDEVVVIDDGSTDLTAKAAAQAGATVVRHLLNRGQGAALETGHVYARKRRADAVIHFDADGQFSAEDIGPAFEHMKRESADVLFGSRFLGAKNNTPFFKRTVLLPLGRFIDRLSGAPRLTDTHNGFRILSSEALSGIHISQDRMAHATEIPVLVKRLALRYTEYPVEVQYHDYGQGAKAGLRIVRDLLFGTFIKQ